MIGLVLLGLVSAISTPGFDRKRARRKKMACVSNLRAIEGAAERYLSAHGVPRGGSLDLRTLTDGGHLADPVCPTNGQYRIRIRGTPTSPGGRTGGMPQAYRAEATCNIHQGTDDTTSGL